jgi:hypothetical protein
MPQHISVKPQGNGFSINVECPVRSWQTEDEFDIQRPPASSLLATASDSQQAVGMYCQQLVLACDQSVAWLGEAIALCGQALLLSAGLPTAAEPVTTTWKLDYLGYICAMSLTRSPDCTSFRLGLVGFAGLVSFASLIRPDGTEGRWVDLRQESVQITLYDLTDDEVAQMGADMIAIGHTLART